jgi:hypothetical protein
MSTRKRKTAPVGRRKSKKKAAAVDDGTSKKKTVRTDRGQLDTSEFAEFFPEPRPKLSAERLTRLDCTESGRPQGVSESMVQRLEEKWIEGTRKLQMPESMTTVLKKKQAPVVWLGASLRTLGVSEDIIAKQLEIHGGQTVFKDTKAMWKTVTVVRNVFAKWAARLQSV